MMSFPCDLFHLFLSPALQLTRVAIWVLLPTTFGLNEVVTPTHRFRALTMTDSVGRTWAKAIQFGSSYAPSRLALGDFSTASADDTAKLADEHINALTNNDGVRVYRVDVDASWKAGWEDKFMYVSTDQAHVDTHASFGAVGGATRVAIGDLGLDVNSTNGWSSFVNAWWDNLNSLPAVSGQGCDRMLIGGGVFDCQDKEGVRCVSGGAACKSAQVKLGIYNFYWLCVYEGMLIDPQWFHTPC
jgi:hypothetical protein